MGISLWDHALKKRNQKGISMDNRFKILSLDGGGIRGYLSLLILTDIEEFLNEQNNDQKAIGERFDLIAGTSTGAIIAGLLAKGVTAKKALSLYEKDIPKVFSQKRISAFFRPQYKNNILQEKAEKYFKKMKINQTKVDLLIPTVNLYTAEPIIFKSNYCDVTNNVLLKDAILASSAAPTFFKAHNVSSNNTYYADGGLVANNPTLLAILESFKFTRNSKSLDKNPPKTISDLIVVSIGTGQMGGNPYDYKLLENKGYWGWRRASITLTLENQTNLVDDQVKELLRIDKPGGSYIRINPILKEEIKLDEIKKMKDLENYRIKNFPHEEYGKLFEGMFASPNL